MGLALSAVRHADESFANPVTTPLPQGRCTIGRGEDADITLKDPTRHISRIHAIVTGQDDSFVLSVESKVNPVYVNGAAVGAGQSCTLAAGDEVCVGDYVLQVVALEAARVQAPAAPDPLAATSQPGTGSPLDDILGVLPVRSSSPAARAPLDNATGGPSTVSPAFNEILGGFGDSGGRRGTAHNPGLTNIFGPGGTPARAGHNPGLTGIFGPGDAPKASASSPIGAPAGSDLNAFFAPPSSDSDPLGLNRGARVEAGKGFGDGGRGGEHVQAVNLPYSPPPVLAPAPVAEAPMRARTVERPTPGRDILDLLGAAPVAGRDDAGTTDPGRSAPADPLAGLFGSGPAPMPRPATARDTPLPAQKRTPPPLDIPLDDEPAMPAGAGRLPLAAQAEPGPFAPPPRPGPFSGDRDATETGGAAAALRAFLKGAGVDGVALDEAGAEAFLTESGALCRTAVEGVMALLLARATLRQELRASDRTMVAAKANNALKMMETLEEAIEFVFNPAKRVGGFLAPPQAFAEAFKDLQAHELAVMAGMRSALMGSIKRFEPSALEKRFELASKGKSSLLANRKALLWDFFVAFHAKTSDDAQDNFDRAFGADFLRAYMEQVKLLK